jgi:hypothetical protein
MPMIFTLVTAAQEWLAARLAAGPAAAGAPRVCMCVVVDGASREVGAPGAHATPAEGASQPPPNALPEGRPTHLPPPPLATPTPPPPTPTHTPGSGADPEAEEKRRREEEEAARAAARAHGTPVTIEAFNAWRARYDAGARVCVCVCVCGSLRWRRKCVCRLLVDRPDSQSAASSKRAHVDVPSLSRLLRVPLCCHV